MSLMTNVVVVVASRILVSAQALSPCHSVTEPESLSLSLSLSEPE